MGRPRQEGMYDLIYLRPPSWKPEAWKRKVFDLFADTWLHHFQGIELPGTPAIVLYDYFKHWCEETFESTPLLGRNAFYRQIEQRYGPKGGRRYTSRGVVKYQSLRIRKMPRLWAEQTPLPMSDPRDKESS